MCYFEWVTLTYERNQYDVCVSTATEELDEIRVVYSEYDITPVMDKGVMDWMLDEALQIIHLSQSEPFFKDMSRREIAIEEAGCITEPVKGD